jgi:hypothetical protein
MITIHRDMSNNSFTPSNIPSWFSNLTNIMTLTMQSVGISGQVPQELFSFRKLQHLILSDNQLNGTLDMGSNINEGLDLVDIQNNGVTSVTVYDSFKGQFLKCVSLPISVICFLTISAFLSCQIFLSLKLSCFFVVFRLQGNPLCNNSLLSDTMPCTGLQTEAPRQPRTIEVQCAHPFIETIVFRAPSFGDVVQYLPELQNNLTDKLNSCTPNQLSLAHSNDGEYLNVEIKACPVNQKRFNYSQVLNCFNLTRQTYKPPELFGPYYARARHYPFHDKGNWFNFLRCF